MVSRSIRNILVNDEESSISGSEYETDTQADEDDTINDNSTIDELEKIENLVNQQFAAPSSSRTKPQTGKGGEDQDFTTSTTVGSCSDDDINTDEDIHTDDDDDGIFGRLFGGSKSNLNDENQSMKPRDVTAGPSDTEKESAAIDGAPTSRMIYLPMEISGDRSMDPAEAIRRAVRDLLNNAKPSPMVQAQETEMDRLIRNEIQEQLRQREAFYAHSARRNMVILNDNSAGSSGGSSQRYLAASSSPKSHHKRTSEKSSHRRSSTHRRSTTGEEREKSVHRKDFNSMSTHAASNVNKSMSTHVSRNVSKQVEEVPVSSPRRKSKSSHRRSISAESDSDNDVTSNSLGKSSHRRSSTHRRSSRRGSGATLDSSSSSSLKRSERDRHGRRMSNSSRREKSSHKRSSNRRSSHRRESSSRSLGSSNSNPQSDSSLCSSKRRDRYRDESMRLEQVVESPSPSQHKKELEQPPVLMQDSSTTTSMTSGSSSPRKYTQLSSLLFQKIQDSPEILSPMISPGRDRAKSMHMRSSVPLPMSTSPLAASALSTRERQLPMRNRSFGDNEAKNQQATTMAMAVPMKENVKAKSKKSVMDESDHSNNATIGKGYINKEQDDDPSMSSTIISMNTIDEDMPSLAPIERTKPRKETKSSSDGSNRLAANLKTLDAASSDKDTLLFKRTSLESGSFHSNLSCKDLGRAHSASSLLSTEKKDLSRGNSLSSLLSFERKTKDSEKDPKKEKQKERERGRDSTLKEASEKSTRGARSKSRRSSKRTSGRSKSKSRRPSRTVEEPGGDRDEGATSGMSRRASRTGGGDADRESTNGKSRRASRTVGGDADREAPRGKSSRASRTTGGDADREAPRGKSSRASRTTGGDEDIDIKKKEKSKEKENERRRSDRKSERKARRLTSTATATTSTTITTKTDRYQEMKSSSKNMTVDVDTSLVSMLSTGSQYASPIAGEASRSKRKDKHNKSQLPHPKDDLDSETAIRRSAESSKKPTSPSKKKKMKKLDKRESKKILVDAFSDMPSLH